MPIVLNFEAFENWSVSDFLHGLSLDLNNKVIDLLEERTHPKLEDIQAVFKNNQPTSFLTLREWFVDLHRWLSEQKLVFIIDEFDATP